MAKSCEVASLCERRGFFVVDVDWKTGKDQESGGEAGDGGDVAGEHCEEEKPSGGNQTLKSREMILQKCNLTYETIPWQEESLECELR